VTEPEVDPRERRTTMVIRVFGGTRVRPGMEDRERQFAEQLSSAVEAMPGFISRTTYPATDGEEVGVFRFDSRESLDNWLHEGEQLAAQAGASEFSSRTGWRTPKRTASSRGRTAGTPTMLM
jgi:antibiotic biosynthesis monooxygenase (ABM) superfamily enzyme